MRRPRGPGGRFLTGDEIRALEQQAQPGGSTNGTNGNTGEAESKSVPAAPEAVES
jgi:hypothetical protein